MPNIYLLVEGRRTEKKIYPKWIKHLLPDMIEVKSPFDIEDNNFYIFNGNGYPSILHDHLKNSLSDIIQIGRFDYFILCLDVDELTVEERLNEVNSFVENEKIAFGGCEFRVILQNRCFETWFLGNKKVFKSNPNDVELVECIKFYNVKDYDPELMPNSGDFQTTAQFHEFYLRKILNERKIRYTKKNPVEVGEKYYLNLLIERFSQDGHLMTFGYFLKICEEIKAYNKV